MALRIPSLNPDRPAHHRATCEVILETIQERCGPVVTSAALHELWDGDPSLVRYSRDTLGLFAALGQVEHVRRNLWIIPAPTSTPCDREWLRAAAAGNGLGPWPVVSGAWALTLRGVLGSMPERSLRYLLTPRPARLGTHSRSGCERRDQLADRTHPSIEQRHVTVVLGARVAAIRRPSERLGEADWLEHPQLRVGVHVAAPADALIAMCEHPRASGGIDVARAAALPVIACVGVGAVVARGSLHPSTAVRRRLAWLLREAVRQSDGSTVLLGELAADYEERWRWDDGEEFWRIDAALDVPYGGRRTVLEPHLVPVGRKVAPWIIDNRDAPLLHSARTTRGVAPHRPGGWAEAELEAGANRGRQRGGP